MIFRLLATCYVSVYLQVSIAYGETNRIDFLHVIKKSLPEKLELRKIGLPSISRKRGCFGNVKHIFVYIYRHDSKKINYNEISDGWVILLPITYTYPSDDIRKKYERKFIVNTLHHKIFLFTDEKELSTWNKFRENLKINATRLFKASPTGTNVVGSTKSSKSKKCK